MKDLLDSGSYGEIIEQLDKTLAEHMERTGDRWDIQAHFPPPDFQTHEEGAEYAGELLRKAIVEP